MMKPGAQQECRASSGPDRRISNHAVAHGTQHGARHQANPEQQIGQPSKAIAPISAESKRCPNLTSVPVI